MALLCDVCRMATHVCPRCQHMAKQWGRQTAYSLRCSPYDAVGEAASSQHAAYDAVCCSGDAACSQGLGTLPCSTIATNSACDDDHDDHDSADDHDDHDDEQQWTAARRQCMHISSPAPCLQCLVARQPRVDLVRIVVSTCRGRMLGGHPCIDLVRIVVSAGRATGTQPEASMP